MDKVLIIKLGALGDVLRTTPLLRALNSDVTWVTSHGALALFDGNPLIHEVLPIENGVSDLTERSFDLVISLDEEPRACELASRLKKSELIGAYLNSGDIAYTDSSSEWFDMSLISRYGRKSADRRKWLNRKTYQEIIFGMLGKKFKGEEYVLKDNFYKKGGKNTLKRKIVGLETRSGDRWVGKRWPGYDDLIQKMEKDKIPHVKYSQMPTLGEFVHAVNETDVVVTTDSLALHIALGLAKKTVAIFTITTPHEIHGYGRTVKIVNPLLKKYYYTTESSVKPGESIRVETVYKALKSILTFSR